MRFESLYEVWAPPDSRWSPWVKPVLFAVDGPSSTIAPQQALLARDFKWLPKSDLRTALVIDCPGDESLAMGIAALPHATSELRSAKISPDAPPAFLLDSRRMRPERTPQPGDFDNRWMVFPQDFPSGNFLRSSGIEMVLLVQSGESQPQRDLAHVLLRWQKAGVALRSIDAKADTSPREVIVPRPPWYGWLWAGLLIGFGLRMHGAGGFGAAIPHPSSGGS